MSHGAEIATSPRDGLVHIGALASNAQVPMHPVAIDQNNAQTPLRTDWLPATYPAARLVTPIQILIPAKTGHALHGQLFLPRLLDTRAKHPAILFLHGGPRRQMLLGYPAGEYYSNAYAFNQYLTSRGFIVLSVNYRCGTGYGLDFRQCAHAGPAGAAEYNDGLAAARYLASRADVDPKRIGIWGGSYGGYLTALALARSSDIFAAGVDFHGVHNWNLEDNAGDWKRGNNAEQDAIGARALANSPLGNLSHWRSPILLIHGDNDPDVAYAQTPALAEALRARNTHLPAAQQVDVEELIFPDEVHSFLLHRDWLAAYTAAAAFFERILKP
jgi:dipeptidyl aminopeptidase/acylaminoacyl peptidase